MPREDVCLRVFRRGGFRVLLIDRIGDRGIERTGGAVFEGLKRAKLINSGGLPLEDQLLLILVIENKKDKCVPAFIIQVG